MKIPHKVYQPISIRRALEIDSQDIWRWRNDPITRENSISTSELSWQIHDSWYQESLQNPDLFLYIGLTVNDEKIGVCRFDVLGYSAEVSINLNPQFRQKQLAAPLLMAAVKQFKKTANHVLTATIKHANAASIRCFEKSGFCFSHQDDDFAYYKLISSAVT